MSRNMFFVLSGLVAALLFAAGVASAAESKGAKTAKPAEKAEVTVPEPNTDPATQTIEDRLRLMQRAIEAVADDARGKIPADTDALIEHLPNGSKDLVNPETGKPIVMNEKMKSKNAMAIRQPERFITFYADAETAGKGRAVIFATGIVKYLSEKDFAKQLAESVPKPLTAEEISELRDAAQGARENERDMRRQRRAEEASKARQGQKK